MNHPLLPPALAFAGGILADDWLGRPPGAWLLAAGALLMVAVLPGRVGIPGLWMGWAAAGGLAHALHATPVSPTDLRRIVPPAPQLVELRGVIGATPALRLQERRGIPVGRTLVRLETCAWKKAGTGWMTVSGPVMTTTRGVFPAALCRGRQVTVTGVLREPSGPAAPGLFDYRRHLRNQGIWRVLETSGVEDWTLVPGSPAHPPWSDRFLPWARTALARGLPDDEAARLLPAMMLGWRTGIPGDLDTTFLEAGTRHVFAISGLHIGLLAALLLGLLRAAGLPRPASAVALMPLLWFYVAATGWQASSMRAALLMSVIAGTWVLNRPADLLNSLGLAALVILVPSPGQLFQAGFQLSFGVVTSLAVLVPALESRLLRLLRWNADPFLPDALRPRWQQWLDAPFRRLTTSVATVVAAFLGALPFTVQHFHLLTPVALLANLCVVPLAGLALAACAASLLVSPLWPGLAAVFNASAWLWMHSMVRLSEAFAAFPGGVWHVAAPPWVWWLPYALVLIALARGRWPPSGPSRTLLLAGAALATIAGVQFVVRARITRLTCLAAGEAFVFDAPGRSEDLVINTGSAAAGASVVTPFLYAQGWNSVPLLAIGQADAARIGDLPGFLRRFQPRTIAITERRLRSPAYRSGLTLADSLGLAIRNVRAGDRVAGWTVLAPAAGEPLRSADDASLVLARRIHGQQILLMSHAGRSAQRALLERARGSPGLEADVVIAGLPREDEPLMPELLEALRPRLVIVTSSAPPHGRRVRPEVRTRLTAFGVPTHYAEDGGALVLEFGPRAVVLKRDGRPLHRLPRLPAS